MYFLISFFLGCICVNEVASEVYVKNTRTEEFREGLFDKEGNLETYLQKYPEVTIVSISEKRTLACHEYSLNKIFGGRTGEIIYENYKITADSGDSGIRMSKITEDLFEQTLAPVVGDLAVYYAYTRGSEKLATPTLVVLHSGVVAGENRIESLWERHLIEAPTFYYYFCDEVRYFRKKD